MKYILQVFTGFWHTPCIPAGDIIEKIGGIAAGTEIDQVIIGWSMEPSVYRKIGAFLHDNGIGMLLWLPVFSEVSKEARPDPAQDVFGKTLEALHTQEGDVFQFVCPSSGHNVQIVKDTYDKAFSDCGFDGVFLDRVRTQSFAAGVSGVLSCACDRCRKAFRGKSVDIAEVRKLYEDRKDSFFDVASWPMNGELMFENPLTQRFFEAKEEIIADTVAGVIRYFKDKGMVVGLDLFAPVISRFVGQRYSLMTKQADFIKPMLYRRTDAPAGIGYEYTLFEKCAPNARGKIKLFPDQSFLHTQLQAIRQFPCDIYPGIEINYDKELVKTDVGYIRESLASIAEFGFKGAVLCWNIMEAPEAHIDAAVLTNPKTRRIIKLNDTLSGNG